MTHSTPQRALWIGAITFALMNTASEARERKVRYQFTIQNAMAGNMLSPPVVVISREKMFDLFRIGQAASPGLALQAEVGSPALLASELDAKRPYVVTYGIALPSNGEPPPIFPGKSRSVKIDVPKDVVRAGAEASISSMIGMSNDSIVFTKVHLDRVPNSGSLVVRTENYDAGSEENTGNVEDFGDGGHPTQLAEGFVTPDRGLNPAGNAGDFRAWPERAAIITIEKLLEFSE